MAKNTTLGELPGGPVGRRVGPRTPELARESRRWAQLILGLFVYGLEGC